MDRAGVEGVEDGDVVGAEQPEGGGLAAASAGTRAGGGEAGGLHAEEAAEGAAAGEREEALDGGVVAERGGRPWPRGPGPRRGRRSALGVSGRRAGASPTKTCQAGSREPASRGPRGRGAGRRSARRRRGRGRWPRRGTGRGRPPGPARPRRRGGGRLPPPLGSTTATTRAPRAPPQHAEQVLPPGSAADERDAQAHDAPVGRRSGAGLAEAPSGRVSSSCFMTASEGGLPGWIEGPLMSTTNW